MCMSLPSFPDGKNGVDSNPGVSLALNPRLQSIIPIGIQRGCFAAKYGNGSAVANTICFVVTVRPEVVAFFGWIMIVEI